MSVGRLPRRGVLKAMGLLPVMRLSASMTRLRSLPPSGDTESVLILVFDSLSAHHLSFLGYPRETTPNLARFAQRAYVYENCFSGGNFTSAGTASLLTGTYPWTHRAFHLHDLVEPEFADRNLFSLFEGFHRFAFSHNLLAFSLLHQFRAHIEDLKPPRDLALYDDEFADRLFPEDYSVAFWGEWLGLRGGSSPPASLFLSLAHRALRLLHKRDVTRRYGERFPRGVPNLHNLFFLLEDAVDWLLQQLPARPRPYLGYVHVLPPHEPYLARRDFVDRFADGWQPPEKPRLRFSQGQDERLLRRERRLYDEYLAYADAEFGRLVDGLERSGVLEDTYVVVTADHGELFERGIRGHVTPTLYAPVIHVPLIIRAPGQQQGVRVTTPVSGIDLLPTLLALFDKPIPAWVEGRPLPGLVPEAPSEPRPVFAMEAKSNPRYAPLTKATLAVVLERMKLIHYFGYGAMGDQFELYDLVNDPEEMNDLYPTRRGEARELQSVLAQALKQANQPYLSG